MTCAGRQVRLHELLAQPGVHVLLDRDARPPGGGVAAPGIHLHRLQDSPGSGLVAVRPDGHVGFTGGTVDDAALEAWLHRAGAGGGVR